MSNRSLSACHVLVAAVLCWLLLATDSTAEPPAIPPAAKRKIDFKTDIQPLLMTHCHKCHGASKREGGLRLDRREEALNGGDSGPAFVSGKSAESLLIKYVAGVDPDVLMPPEGDKLTDEQIGVLRGWIDLGADWPKESNGTTSHLLNGDTERRSSGQPPAPPASTIRLKETP